jgi:hypothetical protein
MIESSTKVKRMFRSFTLLLTLAVVGGLASRALTSDRQDTFPRPAGPTSGASAAAPRVGQKAEAASGTACGDVNANGSITSSDVIGLVNYVFKSGAAPLCPSCVIAEGTVNPSGTVGNAGTGNWTVSWNAGSNWYELVITGEPYFYANYHTSVTIQGVGATAKSMAISSDGGGTAYIQFHDQAGAAVQSYFTFTTTKF